MGRRPITLRLSRAQKRWLLGTLAVVLAGVAVAVVLAAPAAVPAVHPRYETVTQSLAATGRVVGAQETLVAPDQVGVLAQVLVKEGDRVRSGQVLAQLRAAVEDAQFQQAEAAVRVAEAQVRDASTPATPAQIQQARAETSSAVSQAQGRLQTALERLRELEAGGTPAQRQAAAADVRQAQAKMAQAQREVTRAAQLAESNATAQAELARARAGLNAAEAQVRGAQATLTKAQRDAARAERLHAEGAIPKADAQNAETVARTAQQDLDAAKAAREDAAVEVSRQQRLLEVTRQTELQRAQSDLRVAQEGLAAAQARQDEIRQPARPEVLAQQRAEVDSARLALAAAQEAGRARLETLTRPSVEKVAVAQQQVDEARRARDAALARVRQTQITAPYDGIVTDIISRPGTSVGPNQPVLRLSQIQEPEVHVDIDERNLPLVRAGQEAVLTADAYPGLSLNGKVTQVAPQADPQRGTVQVTIRPLSQPAWLRTGLTVDANILLAPRGRHLLVPTTAILRRGDRTLVLLIREGRVREQPVTLGEGGGGSTIILSGLRPGDWVVAQSTSVQPGKRVRPVPVQGGAGAGSPGLGMPGPRASLPAQTTPAAWGSLGDGQGGPAGPTPVSRPRSPVLPPSPRRP